jgi:hypothetical protein
MNTTKTNSVALQTKTDMVADFMHERLSNAVDLYRAKNVAYGDSFGKSVAEFGPTAALVRMGDKWNRIKSLTMGNPNNVSDESIEDTLTDLAVYSMMFAYELQAMKKEEANERQCDTIPNGLDPSTRAPGVGGNY